MSVSRWSRCRAVVALAGAVVGVLPLVPVHGAGEAGAAYVVQMTLPPLGALDPGSPAAVRHLADLGGNEDRVLTAAGAGDGDVFYRYRSAFSGFAARLTARQAGELAGMPGVLAVSKDERVHLAGAEDGGRKREPDTLGGDGAAFLGLPDGLWKQLGGPDKAGEGVIVGVVDSGITPEHPSFAADPDGPGGRKLYDGPAYGPPPGWRGACQAGERWAVTTCNHKLIGARYFIDGFGADKVDEAEFVSARDADGHGSHTAATAAGNYGVDPVFAGGHDLGLPLTSGIAPRARVAAYKACWIPPQEGERAAATPESCVTSDLVAAIDAAVSDGVDVINYSIGSSTAELFGPTAQAFLGAADAGVFVATAAGNSGPEPGTVGSPASVPWVTSVGATTLARSFRASVVARPRGAVDEAPFTARGKSLSGGLEPTPLVEAAAAAAPGAKAEDAALCMPGSLDTAHVRGRVVLCRRGVNPRVEKGTVAREAGAAGMVLYNVAPEENLAADPHVLPAVHIGSADGDELVRLLGTGTELDVELSGGRTVVDVGDRLAPFSARGPQSAVPDIPKPDLVAPGVDILAASTPDPVGAAPRGETFAVLSGTSMASPHVAGLAALLTQKDPLRSPAALRSAMMTTARPEVVVTGSRTAADAFGAGSGRIDPTRAADPGLVLETGTEDYVRYLEGRDPRIVEGEVPPLAPSDLNLPAVSFGAMAGRAGTSRTFTSIDPERTTWTVAVEGMDGVTYAVTPASFDIVPGKAQTVTIGFGTGSAPPGAYVFGALVLNDAATGRTVRLPLSVRPVQVAVAEALDVVTDQAAGTMELPVGSGYDGQLSALGWGLAPPAVQPGQTIGVGVGAKRHQPSPGVDVFDVTVAPGTQLLAGRIGNADGGGAPLTPGDAAAADLDFFLLFDDEGDGFDDGDAEPVAESADGDAEEAIALLRPRPGTYRFSVVGFRVGEPTSTYDFASWVLADPAPDDPATPAGAPGIAVRGDPVAVARGEEAAVTLEWSGVGDNGTYLGLVTWHDGTVPDPAKPVAVSVLRLARSPAGTTPAPWPDGRHAAPAASSPHPGRQTT